MQKDAEIGQTGRHVRTRLKEHKSHLRDNNSEKSAVIEIRVGYMTFDRPGQNQDFSERVRQDSGK